MESIKESNRTLANQTAGQAMNDSKLVLQTYTRSGPEPDYFIKLLLLGDTGVGKSAMLHTYSSGEFP